jgi:hypothetical protein
VRPVAERSRFLSPAGRKVPEVHFVMSLIPMDDFLMHGVVLHLSMLGAPAGKTGAVCAAAAAPLTVAPRIPRMAACS